jgi:hypothetical protein
MHGSFMEQEWSHIKKVTPATCKMGPGAHHHTLEDQWSRWNWQLVVGLGKCTPSSLFAQSDAYNMLLRSHCNCTWFLLAIVV